MKRPKPRKVAKYPELWYNQIDNEMMVIYPDDNAETKIDASEKWLTKGKGGWYPWPEWARHFQGQFLIFLGELK